MAVEQKTQRRPRREEEWKPATTVGMLVKQGKINSLDQILSNNLVIQEPQIVDFLLGKSNLKDRILSISSVQKQNKSGQKTSMKVVMAVGNGDRYVGIGTHSARELSAAIAGATNKAKLNIQRIRLGPWQGDSGNNHTVTAESSGRCGSVMVRVIPAPVGTGIVGPKTSGEICQLAGINDIYLKSSGKTRTTENFAKATLNALVRSSSMYIPSEWVTPQKKLNPLIEFSDYISSADFMRTN